MNELISPKYQMKLINDVNDKIWDEFGSYKNVKFYIEKWHKSDYYNINDYWENFQIALDDRGVIDLKKTLHSLKGEDLIKIAIDLGVDTPDFIPSVPTFKNEIKENYGNVYDSFVKALKNIELEPDLAIGIANSTFESLIKEILKDDRITSKLKGGETLYKLTQIILKEFKISESTFPIEIKTISSSLLAISQSIEKLRSEKTSFHGKTKEDLIIDESIYVYLIINSVTTVGLFLNSFYEKKYPKPIEESIEKEIEDNDLPF